MTTVEKFEHEIYDEAFKVSGIAFSAVEVESIVHRDDEGVVGVEILSVKKDGSLISQLEAFEIFNKNGVAGCYEFERRNAVDYYQSIRPSDVKEVTIEFVKQLMRCALMNFSAQAAFPIFDCEGNARDRYTPHNTGDYNNHIVQFDGVRKKIECDTTFPGNASFAEEL